MPICTQIPCSETQGLENNRTAESLKENKDTICIVEERMKMVGDLESTILDELWRADEQFRDREEFVGLESVEE